MRHAPRNFERRAEYHEALLTQLLFACNSQRVALFGQHQAAQDFLDDPARQLELELHGLAEVESECAVRRPHGLNSRIVEARETR
jgi:hypothetical protein